MPCMYRCMFWFSVRLGSLIVGVVTLLEDITVMTACGIAMRKSKEMSESTEDWLLASNRNPMEGLVEYLRENPERFFKGLLAFFTTHVISCILLICGALKLALWLVYPFIVLEGGRLVLMTSAFVAAMLVIRDDISSLGIITAATVFGTFILLLLFYMWFCTISLCQTVKAVKKMNEMTKQIIFPGRRAGDHLKQTDVVCVGYFNEHTVLPGI